MTVFKCKTAQPGIFAGSIILLDKSRDSNKSSRKDINTDYEIRLFENAVKQLKTEMKAADFGESGSEIMEALGMILDDKSFTDGINKTIADTHCCASDAVKQQTDSLIAALENSPGTYIRERCADIRGIADRLVSIISGTTIKNDISGHFALVCREISPALLSSLDSKIIGALVSDKGSPNSHSSIIAGNIGIPYIYGAGAAIEVIKENQIVIVNGNTGELTVDPDEKTLNDAILLAGEYESGKKEFKDSSNCIKCRTRICANISGPEDIPALIDSDSDGVGLFRSEFLFLNSDKAPDEDEQYYAYTKIIKAMGQKEVIIRTMDIGSDKTVRWLNLPKEKNPALGLRGVRVSLENRALFSVQLRALLRASVNGNLKVMFPMVTSRRELDEILEAVREADEELKSEGKDHSVPELGIMIETPSAAVIADTLTDGISFFSIGTNDLTQYTLALDRESEGLDRYFDPACEAVLRLIEYVVSKAHEKGITVGICGQIACETKIISRLVGCGIDELSVPLSKVRTTRISVKKAEDEISKGKRNADDSGLNIAAVADGNIIPINEIPDSTFAEGILGPCIGINPDNGNVYSPCNGTITSVAKTMHAITIKSDFGIQYLVHIGIDTVKLNGKGFNIVCSTGKHVKCGDLIAKADIELIKKEGYSPVIVTVKLI